MELLSATPVALATGTVRAAPVAGILLTALTVISVSMPKPRVPGRRSLARWAVTPVA